MPEVANFKFAFSINFPSYSQLNLVSSWKSPGFIMVLHSKLSLIVVELCSLIVNIKFCFLEVHEKWFIKETNQLNHCNILVVVVVRQRWHFLNSRTCMKYYSHPKCETNYVLISISNLTFPLSIIIAQL